EEPARVAPSGPRNALDRPAHPGFDVRGRCFARGRAARGRPNARELVRLRRAGSRGTPPGAAYAVATPRSARSRSGVPAPAGGDMKAILLKRRGVIAEALQTLVAAAALLTAFLLRFDFVLEPQYERMLALALPITAVVKWSVFRGFGLHHLAWRYVG